MTFRVYYTKFDGKKGYSPSSPNIDLSSKLIKEIDLSCFSENCHLQEIKLDDNYLENIDLTPLSNCNNLQDIHLGGNRLERIDLTPLAECSNLRNLLLASNSLETVDLSPLVHCTYLKRLLLNNNQLESIDLSPLSACKNLWQLGLSENKMKRIDLAPLANCTELSLLCLPTSHLLQSIDLEPISRCSLRNISFGKYLPHSIDLTPLVFSDRLDRPSLLVRNQPSWLKTKTKSSEFDRNTRRYIMSRYGTYHRPTRIYSWQFLHRVVQEYGTDHRVQQDVLLAMGLGGYGFINADLRTALLSISCEKSINDAREHILPIILKEIDNAIDQGGCTTGLDIEKLSTQKGEIVVRTKQIIHNRERELKRVRVGLKFRRVDLRELYLTAYGYEILNALDMGLESNLGGFEQIQQASADLGYDIKTADKSESGVNMSDELKQAIWWIVENRGRSWHEIVSRSGAEDEN